MISSTFLSFLTFSVILMNFIVFSTISSQKVDPEVQRQLNERGTSNVIVQCPKSQSQETSNLVDNLLKEISEESQSSSVTRANIITELVQNLQNAVFEFLGPVIQLLKSLNLRFEILWISFEIYIPNVTISVIGKLVQIDIVAYIRPDRTIPRIEPQRPESSGPPQGNKTWNTGLIDARCKDIECLGQNVILAFIDTGARVTHQEIKHNWIGKFIKNYGFLDATNITNCTPLDDNGHGTHVTSTSCGKNVGVAPKSKWFMCRACNASGCSESSLKICMQWTSCPYECGDLSDSKTTKNCTLRPHVINNSWGNLPKLLTDEEYYKFYDYIKYWNYLGIISIFSSGNSGTDCTTIGTPAGYDIVIDIGAVDINATLAYFSSVGPALSTKPITKESVAVGTCSANNCANPKNTCALIKPTVVAPGVNITAAWNTSDIAYHNISGTSMAAPHVTGVVALMICANPGFKWNYTVAYQILTRTTNTSRIDILGDRQNKDSPLVRTNLFCNVLLSNICNTYPNNMYGFGLVNACKAVKASKKLIPVIDGSGQKLHVG